MLILTVINILTDQYLNYEYDKLNTKTNCSNTITFRHYNCIGMNTVVYIQYMLEFSILVVLYL